MKEMKIRFIMGFLLVMMTVSLVGCKQKEREPFTYRAPAKQEAADDKQEETEDLQEIVDFNMEEETIAVMSLNNPSHVVRYRYNLSTKFLNKYGDVDGELKQNDFLRLVNMDSAPELALVISKRSYSNISNVTFKYRVSTETFKDNIQPWINVIITSNGKDPDVYGGGAVTNTFFAAPKNDGQWHRISLDISGTGYVAFGNESGHWGLNQTLDYDDIEITYSDGKKAIDSFDSVLLFKATSDATHAKKFTIASEEIIIDEGGDNYMVRLNVGTLGWKEKGLLYTTESYSDITSISFKIRITGQVKEGKESSWMSVNINDTCSNWSGLNNYNRPTDGEWHEITVNIDNQTGHIVFAYNMFDYEEGTVMDFDDIVITTSNGTIEENFNGSTSIFTLDGEYASLEVNK